jgi:hypothetical protein
MVMAVAGWRAGAKPDKDSAGNPLQYGSGALRAVTAERHVEDVQKFNGCPGACRFRRPPHGLRCGTRAELG